jgi:hypothetical protein
LGPIERSIAVQQTHVERRKQAAFQQLTVGASHPDRDVVVRRFQILRETQRITCADHFAFAPQ